MRLSMDKPVTDLVAAHSVCALVLERYQIDYCAEGPEPVNEFETLARISLVS